MIPLLNQWCSLFGILILYRDQLARIVAKLRNRRKDLKKWTKHHFHSTEATKQQLMDDLLSFETMEEERVLNEAEKENKQDVVERLIISLKKRDYVEAEI